MLMVLLITNYILDFKFQSRHMAENKSEDVHCLTNHCFIIFFGFLFLLLFIGRVSESLPFAFFNAVIHGIIDWNIWRHYKRAIIKRIPMAERREFKYWKDKGFYDTIGLDGLLHTLTIIILWQWLIG